MMIDADCRSGGKARFVPLLIVVLFALFGLAATQPVLAHAVLLGSTPAGGAQLESAPADVVLNFNENVGPVFFRLLDSMGTQVQGVGEIGLDGNNLILPLPGNLENGTYIATYRVISADTHPVGGSVVFAVGEAVADLSSVDQSDTGTSAWRLPVVINRFILYASGLLAAGSFFYWLWMALVGNAATTIRSQGFIASLIAAATLILTVPLGGAEMIAGGAMAPFQSSAWQTAIGSTLGPSLMLGLPGSLLLAFGFKHASTPKSLALWAGAALLTGSFLVTGHAATAAPVWLMATMIAIHLVCGGFWFAGLWPLRRTITQAPIEEAAATSVRFSKVAVWTVGAMFVAGLVVTWVQVKSLGAMFDNAYGIRLSIKIGLFLVLLGIAFYNKQKLTPRLVQGDIAARDGLRKTIRIEYLFMLLIVVMAALLTLPTPPRALADTQQMGADQPAATVILSKNGYTAELELTPGRPGENMLMLSIKDEAGEFVELIDLAVEFGLPAASITGVRQKAEAMAPGRYHLMFDQLVIPGEWTVQIDAFVSDFDKVILRGTLPIR